MSTNAEMFAYFHNDNAMLMLNSCDNPTCHMNLTFLYLNNYMVKYKSINKVTKRSQVFLTLYTPIQSQNAGCISTVNTYDTVFSASIFHSLTGLNVTTSSSTSENTYNKY